MHLLVLSSYRMSAVFPGETEMGMIFTISYVERNVKQKRRHRNTQLVGNYSEDHNVCKITYCAVGVDTPE
jgi:hypothetical protein